MATLIRTIPYKNGTLSSVGAGANGANTRLNTSGITWAVGDVGRHVYFYSGNAIFESRKIIAQGVDYCDIDFPFGTFPIFNQDGNDVISSTPAIGNSVGVSFYFDEIDNGVGLIKETANIYRQPAGEKIAIGSQVMIYDTEKVFEFNSDYIDLDGIFQFGDITSTGYVTGQCLLTDLADSTETGGGGGFSYANNTVSETDDIGSLRVYGGSVVSKNGNFWRLSRVNSSSAFSHVVEVMTSGNFGFRVGQSTKALLINPTFTDSEFYGGPFTTSGVMGRVEGINVNNCDQIMYWSPVGGSATLENVRFDPDTINNQAIYIGVFSSNPSPAYTLTIQNIPVGDLEALETKGIPFGYLRLASVAHLIKIKNGLTITIANSSGIFQGDWRLYIKDGAGTELYNNTDADGEFERLLALYAQFNTAPIGTGGTFDLSDFTAYGPFPYKLRKYGFKEIVASWSGGSTAKIDWTEPNTVPVVSSEVVALTHPFTYSAGTFTLTGDITSAAILKLYEYIQAVFVTADRMNDEIALATEDGINFTFSTGYTLDTDEYKFVDDDRLIADAVNKITVSLNGLYRAIDGVVFNRSGSIYYASHAYVKIVNAIGSASIEGAVIGWGDGTTETDLTYTTDLIQKGLTTDANGTAEGYFVYKIDGTTYDNTISLIGEYSFNWATIPRVISGSKIGSQTTPEIVRLSVDNEVTLTKENALLVPGITVNHATETADLNNNTLSESYDNLKARQSRINDIEAGLPGYKSYYIAPKSIVSKIGTTYTMLSSWEYKNFGNDGKIVSGVLDFDTTGTISDKFESNIFDFSVAGTYDFRGATITGTIDLINSSGGAVTVKLTPDTTHINTGPNITVEASVAVIIAALNIIDGSRYQLYNITKGIEIINAVVSGGSGINYNATLGPGEEVEDGDTVRLRATYQSGVTALLGIEDMRSITVSGADFGNIQTSDDIYDGYGVDGSSITKFSADYIDDEIDLIIATDFTATEAYNWFISNTTTEQGIRDFYGAITAIDAGNIKINSSVVNMFWDNNTNVNIKQTDNIRMFRADEVYPVKNPTTGGGGIDLVWRNQIYIAETGVSGLTGPESAKLMGLPSANATAAATWDKDISGYVIDGLAGKELLNAATGGGLDEEQLHNALDSYTNKEGYKADVSDVGGLTVAESEKLAAIPDNPVLVDDVRLNHMDADISSVGGMSEVELHASLDSYENKEGYKADVSSLAKEANATANKNELDSNISDIDGISEADFHNYQDSYANKDNYKSDVTGIPTNPLLDDDIRLNALDDTISSRASQPSVDEIPLAISEPDKNDIVDKIMDETL